MLGYGRLDAMAASFEEAVVEVLVGKAEQALARTGRTMLCVGGGVAANSRFRAELQKLAAREKVEVLTPPLSLCTDNAAMAAIGWEALKIGRTITLDSDVVPGLVR